MKTNDDYFADWESHIFGYGYGSGEEKIIPALRVFFDAIPDGESYDYRVLEQRLGPLAAWLLINTLAHAEIIEYGTSPRFAWLDPKGKALKAYLATKTDKQIFDYMAHYDNAHCYPDHCNCDGEECANPFWKSYTPRGRNSVPR